MAAHFSHQLMEKGENYFIRSNVVVIPFALQTQGYHIPHKLKLDISLAHLDEIEAAPKYELRNFYFVDIFGLDEEVTWKFIAISIVRKDHTIVVEHRVI